MWKQGSSWNPVGVRRRDCPGAFTFRPGAVLALDLSPKGKLVRFGLAGLRPGGAGGRRLCESTGQHVARWPAPGMSWGQACSAAALQGRA